MKKTFTNKNGWWNNYGISPEVFADYAGKLAVTEAALACQLLDLTDNVAREGGWAP